MKPLLQRLNQRKAPASLLCFLLAAATAFAQSLLTAEYRIDGGAPQAMTLGVTNSNPLYWEGEFTANADSSNLSVGPHILEVRMQGTNGVWCEWQGQWFRVAGETHLVAAEWFVDVDSGPGLGTPVPLPEDGAWDEPNEELIVPSRGIATNLALTEGRHFLIMRAKDSNGDWGITSEATFYVAPEVRITNAVWVADADDWGTPGVTLPATNTMRITTNAPNGDVEARAMANSLAVTPNYCWAGLLYARFQDNLGRWSTRHGLWWDAFGQTWHFDANRGWSIAAAPLVVQPEVATLPDPGQRHLRINTNSMFTLDWQNCKGISGYAVYFRAFPTVPFTLLASGFTNSSLIITNVPSGARCQWLVQSLGDPGCAIDGPLWQFGSAEPLPQTTDADRDGVPDDWERGYFGTLLAVNGTTDRDGDGSMDWEEWQADTVPTNHLDFLTILNCRTGAVNPWLGVPEVIIDWNSSAGRNYTIYQAAQLEEPVTVWSLVDTLPGVGDWMSFTNAWPEAVGYMSIEARAP